jgi:hypothetical protein
MSRVKFIYPSQTGFVSILSVQNGQS